MAAAITDAVTGDLKLYPASADWRYVSEQPALGNPVGRLHVFVDLPVDDLIGRTSVELELETVRPGAVGQNVQRTKAAFSRVCVEPERVGGSVFPVCGGWRLRYRAARQVLLSWFYEDGETSTVLRPPWSVLVTLPAYNGGTQVYGEEEVGPAPYGARFLDIQTSDEASVEAAWTDDTGALVVGWHGVDNYEGQRLAHRGYHLRLRNGDPVNAHGCLVTWE